MRLLLDEKPGWRLFKCWNFIGIPRWVIEHSTTRNEMVFNRLWFNEKKVRKIFKEIE